MRPLSRFATFALLALTVYPVFAKETLMPAPKDSIRMKQLAPVLVVDAVEPGIAFWSDRLGFTVENKVPGPDGKLVFASVKKDGVEIMYQTRASVLAERPDAAAEFTGHSTVLFITVENLDRVERAVAGAPVVKPRHETFYGSIELYVREPGGNTVGFAQFAPPAKP